MDSLLLSYSTNKCEQRNLIFEILALKVFDLKLFLRFQMGSWSFCSENAQSFIFSYTIRERERMGIFPKYSSKRRFPQEIVLVGMRYSTPIITSL